jgi:hypothetical protein
MDTLKVYIEDALTGNARARGSPKLPGLEARLRGMLAADYPSMAMSEYVRHVTLANSSKLGDLVYLPIDR